MTTQQSVSISGAYKNLSAHLLEQANPVQASAAGTDASVRQSMSNMQENRDGLQLPTTSHQASKTQRQ